ncbi:arrestin domain-containing protein 3-like [Ceratitis capitata]|uniref:(Mediterranean fruit fly) hypothetical protein n=1 Tax=Ceratitis capitata TaxID=7213 RepID=A0A811UEP6_CERCA|nr:arrestin domain-containing protein 3-like [Ceratitis capitata]CAD6995995.1 unnamed protein product [Ceratitis capitata]
MPNCKFIFERDPPLYKCGERVSGNIEIAFSKEQSLEDLRIVFRGMATVRWVDTMARFPKIYTGEETYMELETLVYQGGILPAGTYNYAFDYVVPDVCATTCTTEIGRIFYEIILIVAYKAKSEARKFSKEIMVLQTFNIEKVPNTLLPIVRSDEMFFCCWPCSAGPVTVHLKVNSGAYIPGSIIKFSIELANMSKRCKFRTRATTYFIQVYKFTTQVPRRRIRYMSYILNSVENRVVVKSDDIVVVDEQLAVPPLPPSTQGIHIISIKYELRLEMSISTISQAKVDLIIPILIGSSAEILPEHTRTKTKSRRW